MSEWLTIECTRALYVAQGRETILCDRLPSPVTLVLEVSSETKNRLLAELNKD